MIRSKRGKEKEALQRESTQKQQQLVDGVWGGRTAARASCTNRCNCRHAGEAEGRRVGEREGGKKGYILTA
jgi:hypothetical protein